MSTASSFATSIVTYCIIFIIIFLIYLFFARRPSLAVIYYPARIQSGVGPPLKRGPFRWLFDVLRTSEDELAAVAGLDAAVYIRFLWTCLLILCWILLFCAPVIIGVSRSDNYCDEFDKQIVIDNPTKTGADLEKLKLNCNDLDKLAMGNVKPESDRLWAGILGGYWIAIGCLFFLSRGYKKVVELRAKFFGGEDTPSSPEQYAALVQDIPKTDSEKVPDLIDSFFTRIYGSHYLGASVVPKMNKVTKVCNKVLNMQKKLANAEGVFDLSHTESEPDGKRPMTRKGLMGLCGAKVDAIEWYTEKLREEEKKLLKAQEEAVLKQGRAAVVFFSNRQMAAAASQAMHAADTDSWNVMPGPDPRDIYWGNLRLGEYQRRVRSMIVYGTVFLIIVFYMIPITFVSAFTTLDNLKKTFPFVKTIVEIKGLSEFLQGILPQLALLIFLALLPKLLTLLSTLEGLPLKSQICRAASGKFFYFIVFNVFLGVTLGGSLLNSLQQALKSSFGGIIDLLGASIPKQATFFITFISLKFLISKALELTRLVPLAIFSLKKRFLCKTEEQIFLAWYPGQLNYLSLVPNDLLTITLALCYADIAPLIIPFALTYFLFSWAIMKHQAMNVYTPEWESRGRMWPHMHARILAALFLSQVTLLGYYGTKKFKYTPILIPLPIITVIFHLTMHQKYYKSFIVSSLDVASRGTPEPPSVEYLLRCYTPEPLKNVQDVGVDEERQLLLKNLSKRPESAKVRAVPDSSQDVKGTQEA